MNGLNHRYVSSTVGYYILKMPWAVQGWDRGSGQVPRQNGFELASCAVQHELKAPAAGHVSGYSELLWWGLPTKNSSHSK